VFKDKSASSFCSGLSTQSYISILESLYCETSSALRMLSTTEQKNGMGLFSTLHVRIWKSSHVFRSSTKINIKKSPKKKTNQKINKSEWLILVYLAWLTHNYSVVQAANWWHRGKNWTWLYRMSRIIYPALSDLKWSTKLAFGFCTVVIILTNWRRMDSRKTESQWR